jgi:hypothetical protein
MADLIAAKSFDASDEQAVSRRELDAKRREKALRDALFNFLSNRTGRDWMFQVLTDCHIFSTSFRANPHEMAFAEGERNIGLKLLAKVNAADPTAFIRMTQEQAEANG